MPTPLRVVRPPPVSDRPKNKLLARLSENDFARVRPHLHTIPLHLKQVLQPRNRPVEYVYLPNGGVASITTVMQSGQMVEVATVGDEGFVGIDLFGSGNGSSEAMMQIPDTNAEQMTTAAFKEHRASDGVLAECVGRYSQGLVALMMQSTACMAFHNVQERCARWLLMTHDWYTAITSSSVTSFSP